jgi:hypothetical protein
MRRCLAACFLATSLGSAGWADGPRAQTLADLPPWAQVREPVPLKALVIGLNEYDQARPLVTPSQDAANMADALRDLGFEVAPPTATRMQRGELIAQIQNFKASLSEGDIALVFFSGHGVSRQGRDYLLPSPAGVAADGREPWEYVSLDFVLEQISSSGAAVAIIVLDACRTSAFDKDAPEPRLYKAALTVAPPLRLLAPQAPAPAPLPPTSSALIGDGLSKPAILPPGVVVAYAAQAGRAAYSLVEGEDAALGSLFTRHLQAQLRQKGVSLFEVLGEATVDVSAATDDNQIPWFESGGTPAIGLSWSEARARKAETRWVETALLPQDAQASALKEYLRRFPDSPFTKAARDRIRRLEAERSTQLAAQPPSAAGAIIAPKTFAALEGVLAVPRMISSRGDAPTATATRSLQLNSTPQPSLGAKLGNLWRATAIRAGDQVRVLGVYPGLSAAKVQTVTGEIGFVRGVEVADRQPAVLETQYALESDTSPFDGVQLAHLRAMLQRPYASVTIVIGPAVSDRKGVAPQLEFDRALNLVRQVSLAGAVPQKIKFDLISSRTPDTAQILVTP